MMDISQYMQWLIRWTLPVEEGQKRLKWLPNGGATNQYSEDVHLAPNQGSTFVAEKIQDGYWERKHREKQEGVLSWENRNKDKQQRKNIELMFGLQLGPNIYAPDELGKPEKETQQPPRQEQLRTSSRTGTNPEWYNTSALTNLLVVQDSTSYRERDDFIYCHHQPVQLAVFL